MTKLKVSPSINMQVYGGYKTPMKIITGDDIIDQYNLEASEILHSMDGKKKQEAAEQYKSPFVPLKRA